MANDILRPVIEVCLYIINQYIFYRRHLLSYMFIIFVFFSYIKILIRILNAVIEHLIVFFIKNKTKGTINTAIASSFLVMPNKDNLGEKLHG